MTKTASEKAEFQKTAGSAGLIGLAAFGGALVGFVLQLIVAFYFGAGGETDAYFMAQSTSELLSKVLLGGSIASVFIPMFVDRLTLGKKEEAWHLALNIFHIMTILYVVLIVLLYFFAEPFVRFIAPGFEGETYALTVTLLRVLLPSFLFLFLVNLATAILHSLKQFKLPALLRIVAPLISALTIIALVKQIGIYSLAVGAVLGSVIQFGILARGLKNQGLSYRFILQPKHPAIKKLAMLVYPFLFSIIFTQGAGIVYRILVSDLVSGSLASLKFAEKITQLLTIIFLNSVTIVIYPLLAEKASKKDFSGIRDTISAAIRLIFFVTIPIVIGVALLRNPLIQLVYQRGSFTVEDAALTSTALLFLVIGLTTNGISSVLGYTVLALKETQASVAVTIASQAIAISLFVLLVPKMAHAGLALASSLVPLAITLLYFLYLTRFIPKLITIFWHRTFTKTILLAIVLTATIIYTLRLVENNILQLVVSTTAGCLVFFGGAYMWKVEEMHELIGIVTSKVTKWKT